MIPKAAIPILALCVRLTVAQATPILWQPGQAVPDWFPAEVPVLDASESVTHMGHLLDPPAGRRGFVTARDGRFVFEDGTRARFWGTNLTFDGALPPLEQADALSARLAKLGFNLVRLHHLDTSSAPRGIFDYSSGRSTVLVEEQLRKLDHLVAALARHGIYYDYNLHVGRRYFEADGLPAPLRLKQKVTTNFVDRLLVLQEEMATRLMTRVNTASGVRYCDDPALALVELSNESSMFSGLASGAFDGSGESALPAPYLKIYDQLWIEWLRKRYADDAALRRSWGARGLLADESLARGTVRAPRQKALPRMSPTRLEESLRFLAETQVRAHRRLAAHLRDLGVRVPITGTQHYDVLPGLAAQAEMDYIDTHGYWNPPRGKGRGKHIVPDASMVANPALHPGQKRGGLIAPIPRWALSKVAGKPFTVSEWNHCWPDPFAYELIPLAAAYADYHDWDGMMHFAYAQTVARACQPGPIEDPFAASRSPIHAALMPLAALIFHRGDLAVAPEPLVLHHDRQQLYEGVEKLLTGDWRSWWGKRVPWEVGLMRRVMRSFEAGRDGEAPPIDDPRERATDTGQIRWRIHEAGRRGHAEIAAPRVAGLIGALSGGRYQAGALSSEVDADCTLLAVSLNEEPLERAPKILVAVVGGERNRGQVVREGRLVELGRAPVETPLVRGSFSLQRAADAPPLVATALDLSGAALAPVPAEISGSTLKVDLGRAPALHILLAPAAETAPADRREPSVDIPQRPHLIRDVPLDPHRPGIDRDRF